MSDKYDLVVFGATSFVGEIVCRYMLEKYPNGEINWAIAARSQTKLDALSASLSLDNIPQILADASDQSSIDALVEQTKVVNSTLT